ADSPVPLLRMSKCNLGYDSKHPILQYVNFSLEPGQRIGLLGPNGAGKSTFIKALADELKPLSGEVMMNPRVKMGYFSQHQLDQLIIGKSPVYHLHMINPKITEQEART